MKVNTNVNTKTKLNINAAAWWFRILALIGLLAYITYESYISKEVPSFDFDTWKNTNLEESNTAAATEIQGPESSNTVDVSDIKGSMTIRDAAATLNMDMQDFYKLFKIPEQVPPQTQMKSIENVSPGYSFENMKNIVRCL